MNGYIFKDIATLGFLYKTRPGTEEHTLQQEKITLVANVSCLDDQPLLCLVLIKVSHKCLLLY